MLTVLGVLFLLFAACAMLYQADTRRSAFAVVREQPRVRVVVRAGAWLLFAITLAMLAGLQGWERGIAVWLAMFTTIFIFGLFLSSQKPDWHAPAGCISLVAGFLFAIGGAVS